MNYPLLAAVLLYEVVLIVGLGLWLQRRQAAAQAKDEFALAGRSLPIAAVAITLALTVLGTPHILGVFEMTWILGASAVWFSVAHVILLVVVCLVTGIWARRAGVATVPELLSLTYGLETRLCVSCVMAGVMFGILTVEAQGIGIIFASLTDWNIATGAVVGGVIGILYVILAGMKEIGWVNVVNAVVMYCGLILAVIFIAVKLPGGDFDTVATFYQDSKQDYMLSIFGTPAIIGTFVLGTIIAVLFSQGTNQMLLQVAMAADSENTVRRALWIAALVNGLFGVFAVVLGLTAKALPEFQVMGQKVAATSMLVAYLPGWLAALLLAAFLAAILSTFAMLALAIATILTNDIYKPLYRPNAGEAEQTRVMRLIILVVAGIAIGVAAFLPPILAAMNWLFAWLVPVFWLVVLGLIWKRHQGVAIATLAVSWTINSLWSFSPLPSWLNMEGTPNAYITLFITLLILIPGNLLVAGRPGLFRTEVVATPATT